MKYLMMLAILVDKEEDISVSIEKRTRKEVTIKAKTDTCFEATIGLPFEFGTPEQEKLTADIVKMYVEPCENSIRDALVKKLENYTRDSS